MTLKDICLIGIAFGQKTIGEAWNLYKQTGVFGEFTSSALRVTEENKQEIEYDIAHLGAESEILEIFPDLEERMFREENEEFD